MKVTHLLTVVNDDGRQEMKLYVRECDVGPTAYESASLKM